MSHYVYKYVLNGEILYIGKTDGVLSRRLKQHGRKGDNIASEYWDEINKCDIYYISCANNIMSDVIESELIRRYKPKCNKAKLSEWSGLPFEEPSWELYKSVPERKNVLLRNSESQSKVKYHYRYCPYLECEMWFVIKFLEMINSSKSAAIYELPRELRYKKDLKGIVLYNYHTFVDNGFSHLTYKVCREFKICSHNYKKERYNNFHIQYLDGWRMKLSIDDVNHKDFYTKMLIGYNYYLLSEVRYQDKLNKLDDNLCLQNEYRLDTRLLYRCLFDEYIEQLLKIAKGEVDKDLQAGEGCIMIGHGLYE